MDKTRRHRRCRRTSPGRRPRAIPLTFMVVHDMLVAQGALKAGEWLLVTGVSAGVGVAALQAAKALGAKVIGTSGSAEKLQRLTDARARCGHPDAQTGFPRRRHAGDRRQGRRPGGEQRRRHGVRRMHPLARLPGSPRHRRLSRPRDEGRARPRRAAREAPASSSACRTSCATPSSRALTVRGFTADFLPHFAAGRIEPLIDRVYGFDELAQAKAYVESDAHLGKVVVRM